MAFSLTGYSVRGALLCWFRRFVFGLLVGHALAAAATQQIPDLIFIEGEEERALLADPLAVAPDYPGISRRLSVHIDPGRCTASTRGYMATWLVSKNELYLMSVVANPCSRRNPVAIQELMPGRSGRVAATWVSGEFFARKGSYQVIGATPDDFVVLTIERGRVIKRAYRSRDEVPVELRYLY